MIPLRLTLRRYVLLILAIPVLVGLVSAFAEWRRIPEYALSFRVMLTQAPASPERTGMYPDMNLLASWQSSEYIIDDTPQVVRSRIFAEAVSALLAKSGTKLAPDAVRFDAAPMHRSMTISVNAANPDDAQKAAQAALAVLQTQGLSFWGRDTRLSVAVLDPPQAAAPVRTTQRRLMDIALRTALGLAGAVALAFLLAYLDDRMRTRSQVERALELPVLAEIPQEMR